MIYRCRAGHEVLHDDGRCHAAVFGEECGLPLRAINEDRDPLAEAMTSAIWGRAWSIVMIGDICAEVAHTYYEAKLSEAYAQGRHDRNTELLRLVDELERGR